MEEELINESVSNLEEDLSPEEKKLVKKSNERARLLKQIEDGDFRKLLSRVAFVLNHYPETRDSDQLLTLKYWETFQNDLYNKGVITSESYMKLEKQSDITRARAKIQNDIGAFEATEEIKGMRSEKELNYKSVQVDISEEATPVTYVFCDESGKTQDIAIVGSVWGHGSSLAGLKKSMQEFKQKLEWGPKDEFHFVKVNKNNIDIYKEFIDIVAEFSETIGFKAVCFNKKGSALKIDDIVTKLYLVALCDGLNHEIESGRATLPRTINIVKDKEDAKDRLILETQKLELQTHIKTTFNGKASVGYFDSADSFLHPMLQIADIFTSCLGRKVNEGGSQNHKDELANYFFEKFLINTETLVSENYDFIEIRFIN